MTTTSNPALEHRDAMLDVFSEVVQDFALNDLRPVHLTIARYGTDVHVSAQINGQDVAAVDFMADAYSLPPSLPGMAGKGNYARMGRLDIAGHRVHVTIYCGLPKLPPHPAGYAPQAVDEEPQHDAGCSCGARGDLDFILEHVCPLEERCPDCRGSGQAGQQADGLIIECPRGCMTGADL